MSLLPILTWPDARLSQPCQPVADPAAVSGLITDMFETMYDAPGRGLAAPQVGVLLRVFVMDCGWKDGDMTPIACINPTLTPLGTDRVTSTEGCLSIPGILTQVDRAARVELRYTDLAGQPQVAQLDGFAALCAQHECDHLDGIVTLDRLEDAARATALAEYAQARP